jgi:hypothetical protein
MRRLVALFTAFAAAAGVLATSEPAQAFCRTKSCDTDPSYGDAWDGEPEPTECVRNAQGCLLEGTPLWWKSHCLSFAVQRDGSALSNIDVETARETIQDAFDKWAAADCGDGDGPSFRIVDDGDVECGRAEYNQGNPNANVFMFRDDDWPYNNLGGDALALTTITFSVETSEIYDADVELNSISTLFTTSDEDGEIVSDLSSVITHEVGHFLGLSHSSDGNAVMRGIGYDMGTTELRELRDDDIQGICEVFPPGPTSGSCTPRHGFASECGSDKTTTTKSGGCSLRPSRAGTDATSVLAAAALAWCFARRPLRRRRALRR